MALGSAHVGCLPRRVRAVCPPLCGGGGREEFGYEVVNETMRYLDITIKFCLAIWQAEKFYPRADDRFPKTKVRRTLFDTESSTCVRGAGCSRVGCSHVCWTLLWWRDFVPIYLAPALILHAGFPPPIWALRDCNGSISSPFSRRQYRYRGGKKAQIFS